MWETTGLSKDHDHSAAFRLFSEAAWNWDELCHLLILDILAHLVPGCQVWLVVDDTLCHKRGGHVAFGGSFLDAVLSSPKHKIYRFGTNWVTFADMLGTCRYQLWRNWLAKSGSQAALAQ